MFFTALIPALAIACVGSLAIPAAGSSTRFATRVFWFLVCTAFASLALYHLPNDFGSLEASLYTCSSIMTIVLRTGYELFAQRGYEAPPQPGTPLSRRAAWAINMIVSRADSRPSNGAIKAAQKGRQAEKPTPSQGQYRTRFLLSRLAVLAGIVAIRRMDLDPVMSPLGGTVVFPSNIRFSDIVPRTKRSLLRRLQHVTAREVSIRTWLVILHNFYGVTAMMFAHCILAILLVVGFGLYEPEEWPHLFGSPTEAYSIGRYWSKFWHQAPVPTYIGYARLIADKVLRFRRGGQGYRVWVVFFVFVCSALQHAASLFAVGFRCGWWEQIYWWSLNFAAVMAEGVLFAAARFVIGDEIVRKPPWPIRALGYVWVFAFQFWSLPKMYFTTAVFCFPV